MNIPLIVIQQMFAIFVRVEQHFYSCCFQCFPRTLLACLVIRAQAANVAPRQTQLRFS